LSIKTAISVSLGQPKLRDMQPQYERLTDDQWEVIKQFVNWQRKRKIDLRDIFDAIFFITRSGLQWRNLNETNFPDWQAVYYYFDKWKNEGIWQEITITLNQLERLQKGREALPSLGLVDSQSIKLIPTFFQSRGLDGNKKVNGRKRHILVDVLGRIYACHVHGANLHDSPQGVNLLNNCLAFGDRLETIMGDNSYRGTFCTIVEECEMNFETPQRQEGQKGFVIEAKRWIVERTFAWLNFFRRVVVDYERTPKSAETFVYLANISMCLWRIDFSAI
jgi:transposase